MALDEVLAPRYGCTVELALSILGGKWRVVILAHLKSGPLRYSELRRRVPRISDKMLTQRLHELVAHDLIERDEGSSCYALTAMGEGLREVLQSLHAWGRSVAVDHDIVLDHDLQAALEASTEHV